MYSKNNKKLLNNIINDIDLIQEAINNEDTLDASKMLEELKEDLKIFSLIL